MICPKCRSEMQAQVVAEDNPVGCFTTLIWLILGICTLGIGLLLIPLATHKRTTTKTYFVCPKCGKRIKKIF